jgi:hypothetical protein
MTPGDAGGPSPWAAPGPYEVPVAQTGPQPEPIPLLVLGPPKPERGPRRGRGALLLVVVLLAAATVVGGWAFALGRAVPQRVAEAYFAAIGRGDAPAALDLRVNRGAATGLLTSAALRAGGVVRPAGVRVTASTSSGDAARVTVGYRLDGTVASLELSLRRTRIVPVPQWRIDSALGRISAERNRTVTVTVAGIRLGEQGLSAFPGRYPVQESDPDGFFDDAAGTVTVADTADPPGAELNLSADGRSRIVQQVRDAEAQCLAGSRSNCPFGAADLPDYAQVGFDAILVQPSWNYTVTTDGVDLITTTPGLLSCTTRTYTGTTGSQSLAYRADATVVLADGEAAVTFTS